MNTLPAMRVLSLMSGTSADGIDAVLVHFEQNTGQLSWEVEARLNLDYEPNLRQRILECLQPQTSNVILLTEVHNEVGQAYADLVKQIKQKHSFDLVALSGQTVYHIPRIDPSMNWSTLSTLQVGEAALVAEHCETPVISDFRQSDMAAGGQGAPMVSFGDYKMFSQAGKARAIHNLGGISNLTYLPASNDTNKVFAFDTGPSNCLIDEAVKKHFALEFDEDRKIAASGRVDSQVLQSLMQHEYLNLPLPKTTGRETFTLSEIEKTTSLATLEPRDLVATLTAFSAESILKAYKDYVLPFGLDEIFVAGGGALNPTLMSWLKNGLQIPIKTFEELGWQSKDREALAFGLMAYFAYHGLANTLPSATGARRAVSAGKLTRH